MLYSTQQKAKFIILSTFAGLISGLISVQIWDIDENGLFLVTLPGWLFALLIGTVFLFVNNHFSKIIILKLLTWSIFTGACFFASAWMVIGIASNDTQFSPLFFMGPGFITSLAMVAIFKLWFGNLANLYVLQISLLAGIITYFSVKSFLETESLVVLFLPYHVVIGAYFGYIISKSKKFI